MVTIQPKMQLRYEGKNVQIKRNAEGGDAGYDADGVDQVLITFLEGGGVIPDKAVPRTELEEFTPEEREANPGELTASGEPPPPTEEDEGKESDTGAASSAKRPGTERPGADRTTGHRQTTQERRAQKRADDADANKK